MNATALVMMAVLFPGKGWFAPDQPWSVTVKPDAGTPVSLVLTDFSGSTLDPDPKMTRDFDAEGVADLKKLFPAVTGAGTYLLYAAPKGEQSAARFVGTPLVVVVREDRRRGAPPGPMVVKVEPLKYALVTTDAGEMTVAFYYDAAPFTVRNFMQLAQEGFYEGLTFHRAEPEFVIQGGDPRGDGSGGPGYTVDAEFTDKKHERGVLSMARNTDPNESPNNPPRPEYANSGGSQFFIALDYKNTAQLDGQYSAFGRIVGPGSFETLAKLEATPLLDKKLGKPMKAPVIKKVEVRPVTARENPYRVLTTPGGG